MVRRRWKIISLSCLYYHNNTAFEFHYRTKRDSSEASCSEYSIRFACKSQIHFNRNITLLYAHMLVMNTALRCCLF